jgi:hypothetical protein
MIRRGATLLLLTGCYPSAAFVGSQVQTLDCRTGVFAGELRVERNGARKVKIVYEQLPGTVNLDEVAHTPHREVLRGKERKQSRVEVRGRLVDRCASGGVNLLASYPPSGSTGFIDVEPVLPVEAPASVVASLDDGGFEYAMTLQCCGPEGAGIFAVAVAEVDGASQLAVEPAQVECRDTEQHDVRVSGTLTGSAGARLQLTVEDRTTGATCEHTGEIEPASK